MTKIPWTQSDTVNAAILAAYARTQVAQRALAKVAVQWQGLAVPRPARPPGFTRGRGAMPRGLAPRFLDKMLNHAENFKRRGGWRARKMAGVAAGWMAAQLAEVVGDGG